MNFSGSGLVKKGFLFAAAMLLTNVISMCKEMSLASTFGINDSIDAVLLAFLLPGIAISLFTNAVSPSLTPIYLQILEKDKKAASELVESVLLLSAVSLCVLLVVIGCGNPVALPAVAKAFSAPKIAQTIYLGWFWLPAVFISGLASIWTALAFAHSHFVLGALLPAAMPLMTIPIVLLCGPIYGVVAIPIGFVVGTSLHLFLLRLFVKRFGIPIWPRWHGMTPELKRVAYMFLPMLGSGLVGSTISLADQFFAARLNSGDVALLNYSMKIMTVFVGLSVVPVSTIILPHFSRYIASKDYAGLFRNYERVTLTVLLTSAPVTACAWYFAELLIRLFLERGAFNSGDTIAVAGVLRMHLLQIPFQLVSVIQMRLIAVLEMRRWIFVFTCIISGMNFLFDWILASIMGVKGIALSCAFVFICQTIIAQYIIRSAAKKI